MVTRSSLRHMASWFVASLCATVILCSSPGFGKEGARRACALVDTSEHASVGALEAKLFAELTEVDWVERTQIDKILNEQELSAAFSAGEGRKRAALGKLVKADLLILIRLREARGEQPAALECSVSETTRGLRLGTAVVRADAKDATEALFDAIKQGLKKQEEKITHIVAVPPFLSEDLGYQYNHLQTAFAKIVEQQLLRQTGLLVVELEEAQAVAKELALASEANATAARDLPLYVLGRYRHDGKRGEETLRISLRLMRGDKQLNLKGARELNPKDATAWLLEKTAPLWDVEKSFTSEPLSAEIEARQLFERATQFQRLGAWEEAITLLEASLLIRPDQEEVHRQAVIVCGYLARKYYTYGPKTLKEAAPAYNHFERGLHHLEAFLATAGDLSKYRQEGQTDFIAQFDHSLNGFRVHPHTEREITDYIEQVAVRRSAAFMRMARLRKERGMQPDLDFGFVMASFRGLSDRELARALIAVAKEFEGHKDERHWLQGIGTRGYSSPPDTLATKHFIEYLRQSKSEAARAAAESLEQTLVATRTRPKEAQEKPEPVVSDLKLEPVTFQAAAQPQINITAGAKAGEGVDFLLGNRYLLIMKKPGELRTVAELPVNTWHTSLVFDGRYMWLAARRHRRAPLVLVIDPVTEKKWQFTSDDGLPILPEGMEDPDIKRSESIRLAPVKPGLVCAAGNTGPGWLALLSFDGKPSVTVFHEARETPNNESAEQAEITTVSFKPGFMLSMFTGEELASDCRILLGRVTDNLHAKYRPLLIDPQRKTVEVAPYKIWGESRLQTLTSHRGSIYLQTYADEKIPVFRIAPSHNKLEPIFEEVPEVWVVSDGERLHFVGRQWLVGDLQTKSLTTVAKQTPWYFDTYYGLSPKQRLAHQDDLKLVDVFPSHHYGTLVVTRQGNEPAKVFRLVP